MNKVFAAILSVLLWIMPWWTGLFNLRERVAFDRDATMTKIADCVKASDVAALEAMMCPWFKENEPDLTEKLKQFFSAIDGEIVSITKGTGEGSHNNGGAHCESLRFGIYTTDTTYPPDYFLLVWYNVSSPKEGAGISMINLSSGLSMDPDYKVHFDIRTPEWQ